MKNDDDDIPLRSIVAETRINSFVPQYYSSMILLMHCAQDDRIIDSLSV